MTGCVGAYAASSGAYEPMTYAPTQERTNKRMKRRDAASSRHNDENHGDVLFVGEVVDELSKMDDDDEMEDELLVTDDAEGDDDASPQLPWRKMTPWVSGDFDNERWFEERVLNPLSEGRLGPALEPGLVATLRDELRSRAPDGSRPCAAVQVKPRGSPAGYLISPGNCVYLRGDTLAQVIVPITVGGTLKFFVSHFHSPCEHGDSRLRTLLRHAPFAMALVEPAAVSDRAHVVPRFAEAQGYLLNSGRWRRFDPRSSTQTRVICRSCPSCGASKGLKQPEGSTCDRQVRCRRCGHECYF